MKNKVIYITIIVLFLFSCSKEALKQAEEEQHEAILSYIEDLDKPYVNLGNDLYRITETVLEEEVSQELEPLTIQKGDSVYMDFVLSIFSNGRGEIFYTNIEEVGAGVIPPYLIENAPDGIKYGSTRLIKGIRLALEGSIEGYKYSVVIPFQYGYGDRYAFEYTVEPYSTLFFEYEVLKIKK